MIQKWKTASGRIELEDLGDGCTRYRVDGVGGPVESRLFLAIRAELGDALQPVLPPDPDEELAATMVRGDFLYAHDASSGAYALVSFRSSFPPGITLDNERPARLALANAFRHVRKQATAAERERCRKIVVDRRYYDGLIIAEAIAKDDGKDGTA